MIQELKEYYGGQFEPELISEINQVATFVEVPEGKDLIRPGQYIKTMPLLLSGSIKIMRPDSNGDELLLYHLEKGDTCAMSMTCCMGNTKSEIHAVTETPAKLLMIPIEKMEEWLDQIAQNDPAKAFDIITKLSEYVLPKLTRAEFKEMTSVEGLLSLPESERKKRIIELRNNLNKTA